jgi:hypothetical protein
LLTERCRRHRPSPGSQTWVCAPARARDHLSRLPRRPTSRVEYRPVRGRRTAAEGRECSAMRGDEAPEVGGGRPREDRRHDAQRRALHGQRDRHVT